jgi:hypothetical protein
VNSDASRQLTLPLGRIVVRWGILASIGVVFTIGAMAQPEILLTANDISGIQLLGSDNVPAPVVAALTKEGADGILPYTVVVNNTGTLPVTGLDVRYEIVTQGNVIVNNVFYGSPGDMADSKSVPVIAAGKGLVISPYHVANEQLNWGELALSDANTATIARKVRLLNDANQVRISVDSVIHSDGVIVGPDHSRRFGLFQQQVRGYTEFREQLLKQFSEGEPDASIISWLTEITQIKILSAGKNEPADRGAVLRASLARTYLALMEKGQRQQCWDTLNAETPELKLQQFIKVRPEVQP